MPSAIARVALAHAVDLGAAERHRRQGAARVAGVDAGLLDVLHDAADVELGAVVERVDVDLDRVVEEPVDEQRVARADDALALDARRSSRRATASRRRSPCRGRRARSSGARAPGSRCPRRRARRRRRRSPCRCCGARSPAASRMPREQPALLGEVDRVGASCRGSARRPPRAPSRARAAVWPPSCTTTPTSSPRLRLGVDDLEHVLERERLEVQPVARVVVGRDRLGVAVDHDRLEAGVRQRERRVHARVVELDALADAVRARAEDDDLACGRDGSTSVSRS